MTQEKLNIGLVALGLLVILTIGIAFIHGIIKGGIVWL